MLAQILIADDNAEIRKLLKEFLESKHHKVLEATDGAQAFSDTVTVTGEDSETTVCTIDWPAGVVATP